MIDQDIAKGELEEFYWEMVTIENRAKLWTMILTNFMVSLYVLDLANAPK